MPPLPLSAHHRCPVPARHLVTVATAQPAAATRHRARLPHAAARAAVLRAYMRMAIASAIGAAGRRHTGLGGHSTSASANVVDDAIMAFRNRRANAYKDSIAISTAQRYSHT